MKYFLDCEFQESSFKMELISLALVSEDGRELYLENSEINISELSPWLQENVVPFLRRPNTTVISLTEFAPRIQAFIGTDAKPEFVGSYCDYDWVCFCWCFGRMVDLPEGWPKLCWDVRQDMLTLGLDKAPFPNIEEHNCLADARRIRLIYNWIQDIKKVGNLLEISHTS